MHGRLKVRTSAEEAARKKKEQDQKVKLYRVGMKQIFVKRAAQQFDDEMMSLTAAILGKNPDISTLWNIRRDCILLQDSDHIVDADKLKQTFQKDLDFTEHCLLVNPKSYCVWHHRCWILEHSPNPNWTNEVDVCTKYLKLDERNFHVWDYRRYIVDKAQVEPEKEFAFCTEKIEKNFSNYSSWHNRSKLLPILYPHKTDSIRSISEEKLSEELEMVITAAFTDPNDSSAWFYQRWLLGFSQPELDLAAFKLTKTYAIVSFSKPVNLNNDKCSLSLNATTMFETNRWKPVNSTSSSNHSAYSTIWMLEDTFELNTDSDDRQFQLEFCDENGVAHQLNIVRSNDALFGIKMPKFGYEFEATVKEVLSDQLKSCDELLEYEPHSKWTLLTAALLMRAIDRQQYHAKALDHLNVLKKADELRIGYYTDLASKWNVENRLERWIIADDFDRPVDMSDAEICVLYYEQYFCVASAINLSKCNLRNGQQLKLNALQQCRVNVIEK